MFIICAVNATIKQYENNLPVKQNVLADELEISAIEFLEQETEEPIVKVLELILNSYWTL